MRSPRREREDLGRRRGAQRRVLGLDPDLPRQLQRRRPARLHPSARVIRRERLDGPRPHPRRHRPICGVVGRRGVRLQASARAAQQGAGAGHRHLARHGPRGQRRGRGRHGRRSGGPRGWRRPRAVPFGGRGGGDPRGAEVSRGARGELGLGREGRGGGLVGEGGGGGCGGRGGGGGSASSLGDPAIRERRMNQGGAKLRQRGQEKISVTLQAVRPSIKPNRCI